MAHGLTVRDFEQLVLHAAAYVGFPAAVDHPSATWQDNQAFLRPETIGGWRGCADEVREAGGVFLAQLWHEGAIRKENAGGPHPSAPSLSPSGFFKGDKPNGRAATIAELDELKQAYVRAALVAIDAGAHGLELHCAHGYLLDQFLWAETNVRDDGYGGADIANRVRFPAEIAAAIRREIGAAPLISVRTSQWKEVDYDARNFATPAELEIFVRAFEEAGVDLLNASARRFDSPEWSGSDLGFAGWMKSTTRLPVVAVGSVGLDVDVMESFFGDREIKPVIEECLVRLLARFNRGEFDFVAIGRGNLADPQWVEKIRSGRYRDVIPFERSCLGRLLVNEWDTGFIGDSHAE